jgi:hypothetical protein
MSQPGALVIVSGGELFQISDAVDNATNTSAVTYQLVVRSDVGAYPFDVTLVSRYAVSEPCCLYVHKIGYGAGIRLKRPQSFLGCHVLLF